MHRDTYAHMCTDPLDTHACAQTHTHANTHAQTHARVCAETHAHSHTCTCVRTHVRTRTHTHSLVPTGISFGGHCLLDAGHAPMWHTQPRTHTFAQTAECGWAGEGSGDVGMGGATLCSSGPADVRFPAGRVLLSHCEAHPRHLHSHSGEPLGGGTTRPKRSLRACREAGRDGERRGEDGKLRAPAWPCAETKALACAGAGG